MTQTLSKEHLMLMNEELDHRVIINAPFIRLQLHCTFTALPLVQCRVARRRSPANSRYICAAAKCSFFSSSVSQFRTFFEENVRGFLNSLPVFCLVLLLPGSGNGLDPSLLYLLHLYCAKPTCSNFFDVVTKFAQKEICQSFPSRLPSFFSLLLFPPLPCI